MHSPALTARFPCPNNPHHISLRALDWLNFLMADVNTGIGIACAGMLFFALFMPETREHGGDTDKPRDLAAAQARSSPL